ncbi:hypothetical protein WICPIJ_003948 [Wickerhamomyces pijperi]|uniref:Uncharacterized protein n=1 Tax=Wickerhamomyces pijperi TaxID=599730 RepID=A0A9P8TNR4_WICPI|nr:hypothetical protein WICPIJ_003948 [Wickerhamomyces pijperi]
MNPITPPRPKSQRKTQLYTPKTPFSTQKPTGNTSNIFNSPSRSHEDHNSTSSSHNSSMGILSPLETPHRKSRRTMSTNINASPSSLLGSALELGSTQSKFLFPPTPSTIGSGRVKSFPLKEAKEFSKKKLNFDLMLSDSVLKTDNIDTEIEIQRTPGKNIITEGLINKWHGEEHCEQDGESDDAEFLKPARPLTNPFISQPGEKKQTELVLKRNDKPLTSIVLINKKGEKIIRDLTQDEDEGDEDDMEDYFQRKSALRN